MQILIQMCIQQGLFKLFQISVYLFILLYDSLTVLYEKSEEFSFTTNISSVLAPETSFSVLINNTEVETLTTKSMKMYQYMSVYSTYTLLNRITKN